MKKIRTYSKTGHGSMNEGWRKLSDLARRLRLPVIRRRFAQILSYLDDGYRCKKSPRLRGCRRHGAPLHQHIFEEVLVLPLPFRAAVFSRCGLGFPGIIAPDWGNFVGKMLEFDGVSQGVRTVPAVQCAKELVSRGQSGGGAKAQPCCYAFKSFF